MGQTLVHWQTLILNSQLLGWRTGSPSPRLPRTLNSYIFVLKINAVGNCRRKPIGNWIWELERNSRWLRNIAWQLEKCNPICFYFRDIGLTGCVRPIWKNAEYLRNWFYFLFFSSTSTFDTFINLISLWKRWWYFYMLPSSKGIFVGLPLSWYSVVVMVRREVISFELSENFQPTFRGIKQLFKLLLY